MKKLKELGIKFGGMFAAFALVIGIVTAQATTCLIFFHQPKVPEGMRKFQKKT